MAIYGEMAIYGKRALPTPGLPHTLKRSVRADSGSLPATPFGPV